LSDALRTRQISYSKARALTRLATPENEHELLQLATTTTAADLGRALAAWLHRNSEPEDIGALLTDGAGDLDTEVVLHVAGDGNTLDDGTPIPDSVIADLIPHSFIRALVHDSQGNPIDATNRRRHPTRRQKRLVKARDRHCIDCGRHDLLEYDHQPAYEQTRHTITTELRLRCAPCPAQRHQGEWRQQE